MKLLSRRAGLLLYSKLDLKNLITAGVSHPHPPAARMVGNQPLNGATHFLAPGSPMDGCFASRGVGQNVPVSSDPQIVNAARRTSARSLGSISF